MMPHIVSSLFGAVGKPRPTWLLFEVVRRARLCARLYPAFLVDLFAPGDRQRIGRHVLGNRRSRGNIRPSPDANRGDQLTVAADERAVFDHGWILRDAVLVAGNRPGTPVDVLSDRRVAEIGEVIRLRAAS